MVWICCYWPFCPICLLQPSQIWLTVRILVETARALPSGISTYATSPAANVRQITMITAVVVRLIIRWATTFAPSIITPITTCTFHTSQATKFLIMKQVISTTQLITSSWPLQTSFPYAKMLLIDFKCSDCSKRKIPLAFIWVTRNR
jgi:hypothetical protein